MPTWSGYDVAMLRFESGFKLSQASGLAHRAWPDLVMATNTDLKPDADRQQFEIKGYDVFKQDFINLPDNGVLVYVNNKVEYSVMFELESPQFQAIWIKLTHPDSEVMEDGEPRRIVTIVGNVCNVSRKAFQQQGRSFIEYICDNVGKGN